MTTIQKNKIKHFSIITWFDFKSKSSFCWRYFGDLICEKDNKKKKVCTEQVFCNACLSQAKDDNVEISFGAAKIRSYAKTVSTGNLTRHLRDIHNIIENDPPKKQQNYVVEENSYKASQLIVATTSSSSKMRDTWLLARDMALWYCKSLMPLDSISDEGMIDFFHKYDLISEKEDMPSKDSVTRTALDDIYESMMINVEAQIAKDGATHAAVALDLWTNRCRHVNYITFMLHYLTADFVLKSFTLCTKPYNEEDSTESVHKLLNDTIECFGLKEKELYYVMSRNNILNPKSKYATGTVLHLGIDNHYCLGQGMHKLVTIDGIRSIPELDDFVKKCTQIVKIIYNNLSDLEKSAEKEQVNFLQTIESVAENLENDLNYPIGEEEYEYESSSVSAPTRWYNVLAMLESLAQFGDRLSVNNILIQINGENLKINKQEWNVLQDLIRFFRKFCELVAMLSAQNTASLNLALIFYLEIKDILSSLSDEEALIMTTLRDNMLSKIDIRFPVTDKIIVAALLDPRFISLNQIDTYLQQKNTTRAEFLAKYMRTHTKVKLSSNTIAEASTPVPSYNESVLSKLTKKYSSGSSKQSIKLESDAADQECWRYLATANATDVNGDDILLFWQNKKKYFPILSELARAILAVPATSLPSKRVFSEEGLILNVKRSRLSPVHLNKMIFIHDNYLHIV